MVPCLIREDMVVDEVDGQVRTYCSETCHWTDAVAFRPEYEGRPTPAMGRFSGKRQWETLYHGWDLADCIKDLGFVRNDGSLLAELREQIEDEAANYERRSTAQERGKPKRANASEGMSKISPQAWQTTGDTRGEPQPVHSATPERLVISIPMIPCKPKARGSGLHLPH